MMSKSCITGGNGFIGKAIATELAKQNKEVSIFDQTLNPQHDILVFDSLFQELQDCDNVYHFAATLGTSELLEMNAVAVDINVKGTVNLLEASVKAGVSKILYPTKANVWLNTYTITKEAGEKFSQMYAQLYDIDVRIIRMLNVYGPGQKLYPVRKAVPIMILQALNNLPIEIYGNGQQIVELMYVEDVAKILVSYMDTPIKDSRIRDIGLTIRLTVNEMVSKIKQVVQSKSKILYLPMRKGEDSMYMGLQPEYPTLASQLGLENFATPLEEGLIKTINYYQSLPPVYVKNALSFYGMKI